MCLHTLCFRLGEIFHLSFCLQFMYDSLPGEGGLIMATSKDYNSSVVMGTATQHIFYGQGFRMGCGKSKVSWGKYLFTVNCLLVQSEN